MSNIQHKPLCISYLPPPQLAGKLLTSAKTWLTIGLLSATAMLFSSCNKDNGSDADNTVKAVFVFEPSSFFICSAEDVESSIATHKEKQTTYTISVDGQEIAKVAVADIISLTPDAEKFPTFTASIGNADFKTFTVTVTATDIDTSITAQFPITLMANTTTNVDYNLEWIKGMIHVQNLYTFWIKPIDVKDTTVLRFTFDGASTAENSAIYFDYTLTTIDGNYVSANKGISNVAEYGRMGKTGYNCAKTHYNAMFCIENFTDEYIRQAKLWKKPKGATDWTLEPDFYIW